MRRSNPDRLAGGMLDCFAEPIIGRAFARPVGSQRRQRKIGCLTFESAKRVPVTTTGQLGRTVRALIG
jgi:hypothetical protein